MKRWQKILLILVLAVTVWSAVGFWIVGTSDCVVRVSFTGLNNIFHVPFEYYAIRGDDAVRIPGWLVLLMNPEAAAGSKYDDQETTQWFAQMIYMPRAEMFEESIYVGLGYPWIDTDFSTAHRIYYHRWSGPSRVPDEQALAVMRRAFHDFHDGDPSDDVSLTTATGEKTLLSLMFVTDGSKLVVQRGRKLYLPMEDGSFLEVMECDKYGQFDYYWFP